MSKQKITPFLWFDGKAEEAANFYVSIFGDSKVGKIMKGPDGSVMGVTFQLEGQQFSALNGGPQFKFTPALSFFVDCKTQSEVDDLWEKLSADGAKSRCGWLQDKDAEKAKRVMQAMMQMDKIDIKRLKQAYDGR